MSQPLYISSIHPRQGFHFLFTTRLLEDPPAHCTTLSLRFILPPSVFADPYELDLHHPAFSYRLSAHPDLELPVMAVDSANTVLAVNATISAPPIVTIPIHARYGRPNESGGNTVETIHLEYPSATLLCRSPGPSAITLVRDPSSVDIFVRVPLGLKSDTKAVEAGIFIVVFAAFIYLLFVFLKTTRRLGIGYRSKME